MKAAGDEVLVAIEGELDVDTARQAEAEMMEQGVPGGHLVLDLSKVPRFDFTGIIVLIDALSRMRGRFGAVSILGLSERIGQVFAALRAPAAEWVCISRPAGKGKWA